jgi:T4-like virus tail tube protein gp19
MPEFEILTANRFYLKLELKSSPDKVDGIFLECQGLKRTQDAIEICEVTPTKWGTASKGNVVRTKIPGNVKSGNLTLKRGMTLSIYDQAAKMQARFELGNAWPTSYKVADLSARATTIELEEMEIAFETFIRVNPINE